MGSLSLHPTVETNQINTPTHTTNFGSSPTDPKDTCSAIKDKETQVTGHRLPGSNKRKWNRQRMYNMVKKTLLGHDTVAPPIDCVTQNMGTSNMEGIVTLIEEEGRHTDNTPISYRSHSLAIVGSDKN